MRATTGRGGGRTLALQHNAHHQARPPVENSVAYTTRPRRLGLPLLPRGLSRSHPFPNTPRSSGEDSVSWATRRLALPLGVPSMFARQSSSTHIHAGGDNRLPCSALLRLGQLVANAGWWPATDGKPHRLIGASFMREWLRPQFPELNSAYGFLTWLNQPTQRPQDSFKRPGLGWCDARTKGAWADAGGTPVGAPASLAMGAGWLAKYVWILPETRTVLVSIGQSWTRSAACQPPRNIWNYDEAYAARMLWRAVGAAVTPQPLLPPPPLLASLAGAYSMPPPRYGGVQAAAAAWDEMQRARKADPWANARRTAWGLVPGGVSDFALLLGASAEVVAESAATTYDQHGKPALLPTVRGAVAALGERDLTPPAPPSGADEGGPPGWLLLGYSKRGWDAEPARATAAGAGSCYCSCPIDLGFGQCFDRRSEGECRGLEALGRDFCPAIGIVNQCAQTWPDCSFMPIILSWRLLQGNPLSCSTSRPCGHSQAMITLSEEPRFPPDADEISPDATGTCECYAERFVRCEWDPEPNCGMRPGNGDAGGGTPEAAAQDAAAREMAHSGAVYSWMLDSETASARVSAPREAEVQGRAWRPDTDGERLGWALRSDIDMGGMPVDAGRPDTDGEKLAFRPHGPARLIGGLVGSASAAERNVQGVHPAIPMGMLFIAAALLAAAAGRIALKTLRRAAPRGARDAMAAGGSVHAAQLPLRRGEVGAVLL